MWCIGALTQEYRSRMYALLKLYARPQSLAEPVVCIDEKSLQLVGHSRAPLRMKVRRGTAKHDYEYVRKGTTNLFVAVEPKAGHRVVTVTQRRGKADFVAFVSDLVTKTYATARRIHLVVDNLNVSVWARHLEPMLTSRKHSVHQLFGGHEDTYGWRSSSPASASAQAQPGV